MDVREVCHSAQPLRYGATWWTLRFFLSLCSGVPDPQAVLHVSAARQACPHDCRGDAGGECKQLTPNANLFDWLRFWLISQVVTRRSTPSQVLQEITGEGELDVKLLTNLLGQMDIDNRLTAYF